MTYAEKTGDWSAQNAPAQPFYPEGKKSPDEEAEWTSERMTREPFHDVAGQDFWKFTHKASGREYGGDPERIKRFKASGGDPRYLVDLSNIRGIEPAKATGFLSTVKNLLNPSMEAYATDAPIGWREVITPTRDAKAISDRIKDDLYKLWGESVGDASRAEVKNVWTRRDENNDAIRAGAVPDYKGLTQRELDLYKRMQKFTDRVHAVVGIKGYQPHYVPRGTAPTEFSDIKGTPKTSPHFKARVAGANPSRYAADLDSSMRRYVSSVVNATYLTPKLNDVFLKLAMVDRDVADSYTTPLGEIIGHRTAAENLAYESNPDLKSAFHSSASWMMAMAVGSPGSLIAKKMGLGRVGRAVFNSIPFIGNQTASLAHLGQQLWAAGPLGFDRLAKSLTKYAKDPEALIEFARKNGAMPNTYTEQLKADSRMEVNSQRLSRPTQAVAKTVDAIAEPMLRAFSDVADMNRATYFDAGYTMGRELMEKYGSDPAAHKKIMDAIDYRQYNSGQQEVLLKDIDNHDAHGFARHLGNAIVDNWVFTYGKQNQSAIGRAIREHFPHMGTLATQFWSFVGNTAFVMLPKAARMESASPRMLEIIRQNKAPVNAVFDAFDAAFDQAKATGKGAGALLIPIWMASVALKQIGIDMDDHLFFHPEKYANRRMGPGGQLAYALWQAGTMAAEADDPNEISHAVSPALRSVASLMVPKNWPDVIAVGLDIANGSESLKNNRDSILKKYNKLNAEGRAMVDEFFPNWKTSNKQDEVYRKVGIGGKNFVSSRTLLDVLVKSMGLHTEHLSQQQDELAFARALLNVQQGNKAFRKDGGVAATIKSGWNDWRKLLLTMEGHMRTAERAARLEE